MNAFPIRLFLCVLLAGTLARAQSLVLTPSQQTALQTLVKSDKDAARLFAKLQTTADAADTPNPIQVIESEGKLKSDPAKIATVKSLADLPKVEALGWASAVTGDRRYTDKARDYVLAWAKVNVPDGDPINETKLEPLLVAYDLTVTSFSAAEKSTVEAWLRSLSKALIAHQKKKGNATTFNNWHSHRLKMLGVCGWLLHDQPLIDHAVKGFQEQISENLLPDGSSFDFHERDALHYHCYDLEPLLTLAIAAQQHGIDLYHYQGRKGTTLGKAVAFLVPFCDGRQTHAEFVNSKVAFDRKRAESGDPEFTSGHPFDAKEAGPALDLAAFFDDKLQPLCFAVRSKKPGTFASWQMVVNAARAAK